MNAALLNSVIGTTPGAPGPDNANPTGVMEAAVAYGSSSTASKAKPMSRFDPVLLEQLHEINTKRLMENDKTATVTIKESGEVSVDPETKKNN